MNDLEESLKFTDKDKKHCESLMDMINNSGASFTGVLNLNTDNNSQINTQPATNDGDLGDDVYLSLYTTNDTNVKLLNDNTTTERLDDEAILVAASANNPVLTNTDRHSMNFTAFNHRDTSRDQIIFIDQTSDPTLATYSNPQYLSHQVNSLNLSPGTRFHGNKILGIPSTNSSFDPETFTKKVIAHGESYKQNTYNGNDKSKKSKMKNKNRNARYQPNLDVCKDYSYYDGDNTGYNTTSRREDPPRYNNNTSQSHDHSDANVNHNGYVIEEAVVSNSVYPNADQHIDEALTDDNIVERQENSLVLMRNSRDGQEYMRSLVIPFMNFDIQPSFEESKFVHFHRHMTEVHSSVISRYSMITERSKCIEAHKDIIPKDIYDQNQKDTEEREKMFNRYLKLRCKEDSDFNKELNCLTRHVESVEPFRKEIVDKRMKSLNDEIAYFNQVVEEQKAKKKK